MRRAKEVRSRDVGAANVGAGNVPSGACQLAWITASRWSEVAALTPNNFTMEPDGTIILDRSVARKTARADPHRALRFVRIRGQEAFVIIKLCWTLQHNEELTNLATAQVERALAPWNATAHSIKRGALRRAAQSWGNTILTQT
ncbi:hypothetical protein TcYC6_0102850 [Trypanosoma cruzi]|nr:hypothetical protein TcYC6_0102850 [Trypanosoma cruzi]